jgi:dihydrofolate reductase
VRISIIVAMAANRVIGRDGGLPWRLPRDLRRFKRLTMGHHLLVGRKTWESIGRPLPGRTMLVVTRREGYEVPEGVAVFGSVDTAIEHAREAGEDELFVGGGAEIYATLLDRTDRIYQTRIHETIDGDTFFPELEGSAWTEAARENFPADEKNSYATTFSVLSRGRGT